MIYAEALARVSSFPWKEFDESDLCFQPKVISWWIFSPFGEFSWLSPWFLMTGSPVCESSAQGFNITFGLSCLLSSWLWLHNSNRQLSALYKHTHTQLHAIFKLSRAFLLTSCVRTHRTLCATLILKKIKYEQLADRLSLQTIFSSHYALAPFRSSCLISYLWGCPFFFRWSLSLVMVSHPLSSSLAISLVSPPLLWSPLFVSSCLLLVHRLVRLA